MKIGDTIHVEGEIVRTQELDGGQGLVEARAADRQPGGGAARLVRTTPSRARCSARLMLEGKRLLITGVLTKGCIAYAVAERAQQEGAEICSPASGARAA